MVKHYSIRPRTISNILLGIVFILLVLNLFCVVLNTYFGFSFHTMNQFYFNREGNLPTIFSSVILVLSSVLLYIISEMPQEMERKRHLYWKILSAIFLFIAADELISIHEALTDNTQSVLGASARGYLYFTWIIPYVIIFAIIAFLFLRFFLSLPRMTKLYFSIAAFTFLTGAVGLEMVGGKYIFDAGGKGKEDLLYLLLVTVEELLEMIGVIIFINALVRYYLENVVNKSVLVSFDIASNKTDNS